MLLNICKAV